MIIWIDGPCGVGKTTVARKVKDLLSDNEVEFLDSDCYFQKMFKEKVEEAKKSNSCPAIRGMSPQTNTDFAVYFRELIKEKLSKTWVIIAMALTDEICKKHIFHSLCSTHKNVLHIILTAKEETIKSRIESHNGRGDKTKHINELGNSVSFLDKNFNGALKINTDNRSVNEIASEILENIQRFEKQV